jgi:hypothetical protein
VCAVHRHFLSDPYTPIVSKFSGVVTKPTAASFVRIAKLFQKIIITIIFMVVPSLNIQYKANV